MLSLTPTPAVFVVGVLEQFAKFSVANTTSTTWSTVEERNTSKSNVCPMVVELNSVTPFEVTVQSWVRATSAHLDTPLADAVARWLATDWPWARIDRCGR